MIHLYYPVWFNLIPKIIYLHILVLVQVCKCTGWALYMWLLYDTGKKIKGKNIHIISIKSDSNLFIDSLKIKLSSNNLYIRICISNTRDKPQYYKMLSHMSKCLNPFPWNASWVLVCWPGGIHRDVMWPGPVRALRATRSHPPMSCGPCHLLCPLFSPTLQVSELLFSYTYSIHAEFSVSKVSEVPCLAFNSAYGHLPLQNYQSVVNSLTVPLSKSYIL